MNRKVIFHALFAVALFVLFAVIIAGGVFAIDASGVARDFFNPMLADTGLPAFGSIW